jgi:hypothetical protein
MIMLTTNVTSQAGGFIRLRIVWIMFCVLIMSASLLASNGDTHGRSIRNKKIGRMAGTSPTATTARPQTEYMYEFDYTVKADVKTLVDDYVEYDGDTCELISSGSWALATYPSYGTTDAGIEYGYLASGDCPDTEFPFAILYYKWTSTDADATTDFFSATWTSGDPDFPPHTDSYTITLECSTASTTNLLSGQSSAACKYTSPILTDAAGVVGQPYSPQWESKGLPDGEKAADCHAGLRLPKDANYKVATIHTSGQNNYIITTADTQTFDTTGDQTVWLTLQCSNGFLHYWSYGFTITN